MLILTRKIGESIFVGPNDEVKIVIVEVRTHDNGRGETMYTVRVGIEAPGLPIRRAEIPLDSAWR